MINWQKFGIDSGKVVGGKTFCPKCHANRKHKRDKSLSVDLKTGMFNCHNCDFRGCAMEFERRKDYTKPVARLEKLSPGAIEFFEKRGISNNTLLRFEITEGKEWMPVHEKEVHVVCFNYFRQKELVNIKFRSREKAFRMEKNAELIFYNLDAIEGEKEVVIVEGEIDCLTLHECGIYNVVSVPNGASKGNQKLEYLNNCWQYFEDKEKIILAVDGDEAGNSLREELARRLGKEKCFTVEYPEGCKDSNEVLALGRDVVKKMITEAKEWPMEGLVTMDEIFPTVLDWYQNGYPPGAKAHIPEFDELLSFAEGRLTTITGIPTHGKDEFANWIIVNLSKYENWPWGLCDFEESPAEVVSKLAEKITGKAFAYRKNPTDRMTLEEFEQAIRLIDRMIYFVNTEDTEGDIDTVLDMARMLVKKKGIKGFRINPWNWLEFYRPANMNETEFISQVLSKIIRFAKKYNVHIFLIAHTTKMGKQKNGKEEIPNLYSISGSAHFFNKTDNGFTVYRHNGSNEVDVHVQKVKQYWLGTKGLVSFNYNTHTRQYQNKNPLPDLPSPLNGKGNWRKLSELDFTEPDKKAIGDEN